MTTTMTLMMTMQFSVHPRCLTRKLQQLCDSNAPFNRFTKKVTRSGLSGSYSSSSPPFSHIGLSLLSGRPIPRILDTGSRLNLQAPGLLQDTSDMWYLPPSLLSSIPTDTKCSTCDLTLFRPAASTLFAQIRNQKPPPPTESSPKLFLTSSTAAIMSVHAKLGGRIPQFRVYTSRSGMVMSGRRFADQISFGSFQQPTPRTRNFG